MSKTILSHRVSITVPSTMGLSEPIDNSEYVIKVARKLALLFGGYSIENTIGGYVADSGETIEEACSKVISFCETLTDEQIEKVIEIALELKAQLQQESIFYEIDNIAYME